MSNSNCGCRMSCTLAAVIAGIVIGVITAFLQITGVITVTAPFLWVTFGIGVVYLPVLAAIVALDRSDTVCGCKCAAANALLVGILGTILFSVILLAVGIAATTVVSAILVALLLFSLTLALGGTACLIRCLTGCEA